MKIISLVVALLIFTSSQVLGQAKFNGVLYNSLFHYWGEYKQDFNSLDLSTLDKSTSSRISEYRLLLKNFHSLNNLKIRDWVANTTNDRRRDIERSIVALINTPGIRRMAYDYSFKATLYYEWEGMVDGPLNEAKYAQSFLMNNPNTPLKPFLYLFLMHRFRSAYECAVYEKMDKSIIDMFAERYRSYRDLAKNSSDQLVRLIAEDMNSQEYIYLEARSRP